MDVFRNYGREKKFQLTKQGCIISIMICGKFSLLKKAPDVLVFHSMDKIEELEWHETSKENIYRIKHPITGLMKKNLRTHEFCASTPWTNLDRNPPWNNLNWHSVIKINYSYSKIWSDNILTKNLKYIISWKTNNLRWPNVTNSKKISS